MARQNTGTYDSKDLDIQIIMQHVTPLETTVTIECSSSTYTFLDCELCKDEFMALQTTRSSTKPVFQYVINNAAAWHESIYTCSCSFSDGNFIRGDYTLLLLSDQIDEPQIYVDEDTGALVCASENSRYKYKKCVLFQSGLYLFYMNCLSGICLFGTGHPSARNNLSCSCYVAEASRWTRHSSVLTNEEKWHLKKPDIEVIIHGQTRSGTSVTIKCSTYELFKCALHKNTQQITEMSRPSIDSAFYYDIQNAIREDEGFYQCECEVKSSLFRIKKTSPHVPLILNDQVDEPEIQLVENETKIVCASKNRSYEYWLCILYQNGQQIRDAFPEYNSTDRVSFDVADLPTGGYFSCLCYTYNPSKWTRSSSVIVKGGKYTDYTVMNTIRLGLGFLVILWMIVLAVESRYQSRRYGAGKQSQS
ncbi:uncharacterized protein LOC122803987 [Protopterus annectens]|uniref:uncharacterized protein LOC122803987 n=1 Tax=Protopterus annectens TaxID=7888 RepID=UPI001CFA6A01|nr:uncharacterized protein LOC122803987 [Protopterus annectens]